MCRAPSRLPRTPRPARMPTEAEQFAAWRADCLELAAVSDDDLRAALARWCEGFLADLDALLAGDDPVPGERGPDGGDGPNT